MKLFNGKAAANKILREVAQNIKKEKLKPALAVILVGENEASKLYVALKKKAAKKVGIDFFEFCYPAEIKEEDLILKIKEMNEDKKITGIIVQLPLPAIINTDNIITTIDPKKDVDGFCQENIKAAEKGEKCLASVLPSAIALALEDACSSDYNPSQPPLTLRGGVEGKEILALVNSDLFGRTLKMVLEKEGLLADYLVRNVCVIKGAEKDVASADILISACGCPNFIKSDMIKEGAILIDAGVTRFSDGKVVGDIDEESVTSKASFLTPVPGGIGPVTVALLLRNVYLAAKTAKHG